MEKGSTHAASTRTYHILLLTAAALLLAAVAAEPSLELFRGLWRIVTYEAGLITDPVVTGGLGAALLNMGLVLLCGVGLARSQKLPFTGASLACLLMLAGFAMLGKNILNIQPILLGTWLYSRFTQERFAKYVYLSLYGTCLAPMVSYVLYYIDGPLAWAAMVAVGLVIGFFLPPIAAYTSRIHQGYNLYNVGFSAGFVGMAVASVLRGFGVSFETQGSWSSDAHWPLMLLCLLFFAALLIGGIVQGGRWPGYKRLCHHSGRAVADFVVLEGLPVTMVNMGACGLIGLVYYLVLGVPFSGPMVCCLFSLCGFAAFGKHPKNILPVIAGAVLTAFLMHTSLRQQGVLLAAIFCTGLAPIAGQYGPVWGFIAGCLHMAVVLNTSFLHGGMNLYNNGFAAGLVCVIMIPVINALQPDTDG